MSLSKTLQENYRIVINGEIFSVEEITNFTNINTKTYAITPQRTSVFSIPDIMDINTAKIARLKINFENMPIALYRKLKRAIEPNEFLVTYYDYEYDLVVEHLMYIEPEDLDEFYLNSHEQLVVLKKSISLIATMNEVHTFAIIFDYNGGKDMQDKGSIIQQFKYLDSYTIIGGKNVTKDGFTSIIKWNTQKDGSGIDYTIGSNHTSNVSRTLFAIWG